MDVKEQLARHRGGFFGALRDALVSVDRSRRLDVAALRATVGLLTRRVEALEQKVEALSQVIGDPR